MSSLNSTQTVQKEPAVYNGISKVKRKNQNSRERFLCKVVIVQKAIRVHTVILKNNIN